MLLICEPWWTMRSNGHQSECPCFWGERTTRYRQGQGRDQSARQKPHRGLWRTVGEAKQTLDAAQWSKLIRGRGVLFPTCPEDRARPLGGVGTAHDFDFCFTRNNTKTIRGRPMKTETEQAYRKLAEHFYATRLGGQPPTPKKLADALKACAGEYRPAYFRRLRNALEFDQHDKGFGEAALRVAAVKNPVTAPGSTAEVKAKRAAVKRVTDADETRMLKHLIAKKDRDTYYVVQLIAATGARPAELKNMVIEGDRVTILGAKKSHGGQRGADRVIVLAPGQNTLIANAIAHMPNVDLSKVKDRLRAAGQALWPQRKALPSMYSWRHQMGSDLKASGLSRVEVAYIMGHQSTESVDRYGNARTARKGAMCPRADKAADMSQVRELHKQPPGTAVAAPANARSAAHDSPTTTAALVDRLRTNGGGLRVSNQKFANCQEVSGLKLER